MKVPSPQTIRLQEYQPPAYLVSTLDLRFDLGDDFTEVTAKTVLQKNAAGPAKPLELDGEKMELRSLKLNGKVLGPAEYVLTETQLTLPSTPQSGSFEIEIVTRIKPQENLTLEGLYKSGGMFCTQCEAQGFRRITYYQDRPDVMAIFTTTIVADKERYPILLSNGNLVEKKDLGGGKHSARWNDPFKKPAYLYALVAGDLGITEDHFVTRSGRRVKLEIYTDKGNESRTLHAMDSLKKSMKWDEDTFGLEYDLDIFMIVAVDDFNFGAMENKGLNIFNSNYVLANPATATDTDYENIEAVVAHEYFHNWTGNRVTCRDWFQLSLKEGLTVYRDQEFSSDMGSRAVCRVDNVNRLRMFQFAEDAGPMAHPIRPSSYIEINNFYTATVYEKGAEVIRMIATILGKQGFRKGMDKYFELYDGQAVTTEDFVRAMELANNADLRQLRETWYEQAGTPVLEVKGSYSAGKYTLTVKQTCPATPGQPTKRPFHIPLDVALLDPASGQPIAQKLLQVTKESEEFVFDAATAPVPSLLRGFSAPVKLKFAYGKKELLFLLAKDGDPFARWEAGQMLSLQTLGELVTAHAGGKGLVPDPEYVDTLGAITGDRSVDPAFRAQLLDIPEEGYIGQQLPGTILVDSVWAARNSLVNSIAERNETRFAELYASLSRNGAYRFDTVQTGCRALRNAALGYLCRTGKAEYRGLALAQVKNANNMTDEVGGLRALVNFECAEREEALHHFYQKWNKETLVMNKWLSMQAVSDVSGGLQRIQRIMNDPVFNLNNPNKVSSLLLTFGKFNVKQFHAIDGSAYKFFADLVLDIDTRNPSLASRTVSLFNQWKRYDTARQKLMRQELERIVAKSGISAGVFEIASKSIS
ncbi:MAG: aminopeptidase N [Bdellovibrionota bacterium]